MKLVPHRLGDFLSVKHGFAFKSQYFTSEGPMILMTPGHFHDTGGFRDQGAKTKYYEGDIPEGYILDEGDLVIVMTEQMEGLLGSSVLVPEPGRFLHNQRLGRIIDIDESLAHKRYLYYLFNTHGVRGQISASASGTKVRHTSPGRIADVRVDVPLVATQERIASMLAAYDDLIENNTRRIKLLEEAARLLYEEWFVRLRFPGHEHTPVVDGVPEGWTKPTLESIASLVMGQSPKSMYYNEDGDGLPFHQGVTDFGTRFPSHRVYCTVQKRLAEAGDILFSVRAPVGRINLALDKLVVGRGVAAIRSTCGQQNWLFYALKSYFFKEDLIGGGAIFAAITKKDLHSVQLLQPTEQLATLFTEFVQPIDALIEVLHRATIQLRQAHDLLLPRLMTGEVAV